MKLSRLLHLQFHSKANGCQGLFFVHTFFRIIDIEDKHIDKGSVIQNGL